MKIKGLVEYDISNYYKPSMFIIFPSCTFKCDEDCGRPICQNSALAHEPVIEYDKRKIIDKYLANPLTKAIVCGGLEPLDSFDELYDFIRTFRLFSGDDIVIYTGYTIDECAHALGELAFLADNIIVKVGRFIPDDESRYDNILGITLASSNQYAVRIS